MLQPADQDTSPLSEGEPEGGGWQNNYIYTTIEFGGLDFWWLGPPLEKRHCRVMSNMIDMCVFMDYLFIYSPFVYIP